MKQLTHLRDGNRVAEYLLDVEAVVIGRGRGATIRLDGNKVVSRQHAVVRRRSGIDQHVVEDLGGANGTFVNDFRVEVHVLRPGDRIVLGKDTLRYEFSTRNATSLRPAPPPRGKGKEDARSEMHEDVEDLQDVQVDVVEDLAEVREAKRRRAEADGFETEDRGERTTVADRDDLDRLLREMRIRSKPHLVVRIGDQPERLVSLDEPPVRVGNDPGCQVRLPGWKLLGRLAATLVQQAGGWCLVPESPVWNPIRQGGARLRRIRQLESGDELCFRGASIVFRKGEGR